jgi:hypothetical protein
MEIHRNSASFYDRSATVCPMHFRSTAIDASETSATSVAEEFRPEIVVNVTASVKTLFHNRLAKYRKYIESRLRSTTDQPPYVTSTSGQRQSMPLKHRQPLYVKNLTRSRFLRHRKRHNTIPQPPRQIQKIHRKSGSFDDRSATVCPIDLRSTAIDTPQTPAFSDAEKLDRI